MIVLLTCRSADFKQDLKSGGSDIASIVVDIQMSLFGLQTYTLDNKSHSDDGPNDRKLFLRHHPAQVSEEDESSAPAIAKYLFDSRNRRQAILWQQMIMHSRNASSDLLEADYCGEDGLPASPAGCSLHDLTNRSFHATTIRHVQKRRLGTYVANQVWPDPFLDSHNRSNVRWRYFRRWFTQC